MNSSIQFHNVFGKDTISTRETSLVVCVADGEAFIVSAYTTTYINIDRKTVDWERATETWGSPCMMDNPVMDNLVSIWEW